jgi:hypothetical protein
VLDVPLGIAPYEDYPLADNSVIPEKKEIKRD